MEDLVLNFRYGKVVVKIGKIEEENVRLDLTFYRGNEIVFQDKDSNIRRTSVNRIIKHRTEEEAVRYIINDFKQYLTFPLKAYCAKTVEEKRDVASDVDQCINLLKTQEFLAMLYVETIY